MMSPQEPMLAEAIAAHQRGDLQQAETLYRTVVEKNPQHADAYALLGIVMGARGDFENALIWAEKAISLDPASGLLRFHLGTILLAAQKGPEAIVSFQRALALQPDTAPIHFNLANALRASGDWVGAITHYREALRCDANYLAAYNNLALSLVHEKDYEEAQRVILRSLELDPDYGDGWLTLCNVAEKRKDYDVALKAGEKAILLKADDHYAWFGYGVALNRLDRDLEAIKAYECALALNPQRADILDNLAQTYQSLNQLEKAEQVFREAVHVAGQAIADEEGREIDEREYGNRHWHLALIELLRGKYRQGFARYRARVNEIKELKRLSFPFPLWKGEDLRGKSLLVCDEQGYGDTLMLARFLPLLRARGVRIVFSVHKVLVPLFKDWDGADQIVTHDGQVPACDYFCSSFDLPHLMGTTLETLPHHVPYIPVLSPDAATALPAGGFKVGVVWGGSPLHGNDHKRSVPLAIFAELFALSGIEFYSFNRDLKPGDADLLPFYKIENLVPRLIDFAAAARLVGQMDLIIACDTATAHLAGALGKSVWVLLPFAPDWRWLTDRADSPWYPTAHLFRQPRPGDWRSVIQEVKKSLSEQIVIKD